MERRNNNNNKKNYLLYLKTRQVYTLHETNLRPATSTAIHARQTDRSKKHIQIEEQKNKNLVQIFIHEMSD